jgi:hypothetical protein
MLIAFVFVCVIVVNNLYTQINYKCSKFFLIEELFEDIVFICTLQIILI